MTVSHPDASANPLKGFADILFEDRHLIVVNKYPGIPVIPERRSTPGVLSLRERLELTIGGKIFVVHRIDRDTSGIVVFCRTAQAHRMLSMQFERRCVKKEYRALVLGELSGPISAGESLRQFGSGRMGVDRAGKPSRTDIAVVKSLQGATLVTAQPLTGRRHQIRVHLYHHGHPVMGDRVYGTERPVGGIERMMLHAASLSFFYPEGKSFAVHAPVDANWKEIAGRFKSPEPMRKIKNREDTATPL